MTIWPPIGFVFLKTVLVLRWLSTEPRRTRKSKYQATLDTIFFSFAPSFQRAVSCVFIKRGFTLARIYTYAWNNAPNFPQPAYLRGDQRAKCLRYLQSLIIIEILLIFCQILLNISKSNTVTIFFYFIFSKNYIRPKTYVKKRKMNRAVFKW